MTTTLKSPAASDRAADSPAGPTGPLRPRTSSSTARWWAAVAAASAAGIPCGVVLSYAALLPFYIGVFFFALFGLMVGAFAFRIGSPSKPYPGARIILGTTVIVLVTFVASIVKEGRDFPKDMATRAIKSTRDIGTMTAAQFREKVALDVRQFLRDRYWPGGTVGYLRWALTSGRIPKSTFDWVEKELVFPQARYLLVIRIVLSIGLLAFGVASQTWAMHLPSKSTD